MVVSKWIAVQTEGNCSIADITKLVQAEIARSGLQNGIATLFVQGSTAGLTTMEFEPGLVEDLQDLFDRLIPEDIPYKHDIRWHDGNGHSHTRAALMGPSLTIPFVKRELTLGTWQQVVVVDFDNKPRKREIMLQLLGE